MGGVGGSHGRRLISLRARQPPLRRARRRRRAPRRRIVAPEVLDPNLEHGAGYGPEVDLWSVGVMLYSMLCGFPPFFNDCDVALIRQAGPRGAPPSGRGRRRPVAWLGRSAARARGLNGVRFLRRASGAAPGLLDAAGSGGCGPLVCGTRRPRGALRLRLPPTILIFIVGAASLGAGQIRNADFKFHSPYWDAISFGAKDLISNLLVVDPARRYTAHQCLEHCWIARVADVSTSKLHR